MQFLPRLRVLKLLNYTLTSLYQLKQTHAQLITNGLNSTTLLAKLINQYCALSNPQSTHHYAHLVFKYSESPNIYLFNTLIRCSQPKQSILVFSNWVFKGDLVFDDFTYIFILGACARFPSLSTLWVGTEIHTHIVKLGFVTNILIQTTLIHFYASNMEIVCARQMFDEMPMRNCVTWNAMITGYVSQKENTHNALALFRDMVGEDCDGVPPTDTTMVSILSAVAQLGVLETGACIHGYIEKTICVPENDVFIGTSLVDMYTKCGSFESALSIFMKMREKNVLTWTSMATGLAIHGRGKEALELLNEMEANTIKPNAVTFTSLLLACCHVGLVEEGLHLFNRMSKFSVKPQMQHYGCIVDLLSRAGHLKEAYEFIKEMPVEPDLILWRSLLSACKVHGDLVMGETVGKLLMKIKQEQRIEEVVTPEDYVALSNIYACGEKWKDLEMLRKEMRIKGIENKPGCSLVSRCKE